MYLMAVRAQVQPGKAEEVAQKWKNFYGSRAKETPEFQQAYFSDDRATGAVLAVSVWSTKPDETQVRQDMQEFASQVRDLIVELPSKEGYEVLQQI